MAKRKPNVLSKYIPELMLGVGVLLVILSVTHKVIQIRTLRLDRTVVQEYLSESATKTVSINYPTHITIPWYVDVAIEPQIYQDGAWTVSPNIASYLTASSLPGTEGNVIIYGHNKRNILGNIRALKGYEKITLTMANGETKIYQVESMQEVSPTSTKLLSPTSKEALTIYTCSGFLDSQRFVVRAIPVL